MNTRPRCLLVEDNPGDARLLRAVLPPTFGVVHVTRLDDALAHLGAHPVDVVLLDLSLPDSHGVETFQRLHEAFPDVAVTVLTGLADDTLALQAVREGAQDWLVKGAIDGDALARAIRYAIERNRLSTRLVQVDRMRTLLMSVVTHDLRSPASAIQAGVDLLLGGALGELTQRQQHTLQLVRRNAQRQTRLITDLLDLAVIEAGALPLRLGEGSIAGLVTAALEEIEPLIAERQLRLRASIETDTTIPCDPDRISQAIGNLLSNAMKFAREEIGVAVRRDADRVVVAIDDDGAGIPADELDRIFEWYVRGSGSGGGTGLGLPIVKGIVLAHKGRVTAENRTEGGARFTISLPFVRE